MCCSSEGVERTPEGESSEENEDIEFFDAMEDSPAFITVPAEDHSQHRFIYRSHNRLLLTEPDGTPTFQSLTNLCI